MRVGGEVRLAGLMHRIAGFKSQARYQSFAEAHSRKIEAQERAISLGFILTIKYSLLREQVRPLDRASDITTDPLSASPLYHQAYGKRIPPEAVLLRG